MTNKLHRLIDANLNRLREGIRVCEDIERYINDNKTLSKELKSIRHNCRIDNYEIYLQSRDIVGDVLKKTTDSEASRSDIRSIQVSNIKRAQESARVLEESLKLISIADAEKFKQIRYALYDVEKAIF
ncbi:MAG: thiamine-phosphate pyrophosphorylase [Epsilonproteobacteria bacterium]|nr:thiamine-phosphate pyrophosphorylase [Campylobacterota bacterium]